MTFHPSGKFFLTGHDDGSCSIWELSSRRLAGQKMRHDHYVSAVELTPDASRVVTSSWDGTVRIWDLATQTQVGEPFRRLSTYLVAFKISPDGHTVLVGNRGDASVHFLSTETGKDRGVSLLHQDVVVSVGYDKEGKRVFTICNNGAFASGTSSRPSRWALRCTRARARSRRGSPRTVIASSRFAKITRFARSGSHRNSARQCLKQCATRSCERD